MKTKLIYASIFIFILQLFCFGSCEKTEPFGIIIHNNSKQDIIIIYGSSFKLEDRPNCIKPNTSFEYKDMISDLCIKARSSKNFEMLFSSVNKFDTVYTYVFNRADVDTLSCEEFEKINPIQKRWDLTKKVMEQQNWILSYP